jgi:hypothetical protein
MASPGPCASASRRLALPAVLAIALSLGACGSDGGDGRDGGDGASVSERALRAEAERRAAETKAQGEEVVKEYRERKAASAPTEEEEEAEETTTRFYEILGEDEAAGKGHTTIDAAAFCDLMSEKAQAQTIDYARVSSAVARKWDCETAVEQLVLRSKGTGGFRQASRAEVLGVNTEGGRGTATIRFGGGAVTSVPLVREGDEWKLAQSEVGG